MRKQETGSLLRIGLTGAGVLCLTLACSRHEAPAAKPEIKAIEIAPTPQPVEASNRKGGGEAAAGQGELRHTPAVVPDLNAPHVAAMPAPPTQGEKKALRQHQREFAAQQVAREISRQEALLEKEHVALDRKECELREGSAALRDAYARTLQSQKEYEHACTSSIKGYSDLVASNALLHARLDELALLRTPAEGSSREALASLRGQLVDLAKRLNDARAKANADDPQVKSAMLNVIADQRAYCEALSANEEYSRARLPSDKILDTISNLTSMQGYYKQEL